MITENTFFGTDGLAVLISEESNRDDAVVYTFEGYPKAGENIMAMSITDVSTYVEHLTDHGYVSPSVWRAQGSVFVKMSRNVGVAARMIATNALRDFRYRELTDQYENFEEHRHTVEFFREDDETVTFVESGSGIHSGTFALSEDELDEVESNTCMVPDVAQAYADAFETTDVDDFEGEHFAGQLDGGQTLEEWYLEYIEDYDTMVGDEAHTVSDLISSLNDLGLTVEATDTIMIQQEFTEQDGYVFRNH